MSETLTNDHTELGRERGLGLEELNTLAEQYGLGGNNSQERLAALRTQTKENIALFMTDLNRRLLRKDETQIHDATMKIGEVNTIAPEERYDLFSSIIDKVQSADEDINPARVGDALALSVVLLHPFKDGNGRTARLLGFMYRDDTYEADASSDFDILSRSRDEARSNGEFMVYGYIPNLGEGVDQSDPAKVNQFMDEVLTDSQKNLYIGPFGQADFSVNKTER